MKAAQESNSQTATGQLNRPVVRYTFDDPKHRKPIKVKRMTEADKAANGKFVSDQHTANAREHVLAASIAANSNDTDEAGRRIQSAQIHSSHSQNKTAPQALVALKQAEAALAAGNIQEVQKNLDIAYSQLQGLPNTLLKMKKVREAAVDPKHLIETLTFNPRFIEGSFDREKRTVAVEIISEGLGNKRDRHYYLPSTLKDAAKAGGPFDGAQAYADHPSKFDDANRPERSVRDLIGWYFAPRIVESAGKVTLAASLKVQEGCDWALDLIKESIEYSKKFPDKVYVGISINADGDTMPNERDGLSVNDVTKITEAFSADMVTKPARGGKFLKLVESVRGSSKENMVNKILDAATQLKKLAEGEEIDPSILRSLATTLEESQSKEAAGDIADFSKKGGMDTGTGTGTANDLTKKGKSVLESLTEGQKEAWGKSFGSDDGKKKWESMSEADQKKWSDDNSTDDTQMTEKKKKEAMAALESGNLTESQIKELFPSLYQSALREATKIVATDNDEVRALREANAKLEAEKQMREAHAKAANKLRESNIAPQHFKYALTQLIGKSDVEMAETISFLESMTGSADGQRSGAGGGNLPLRESSRASNTAMLIDGVTEE